MASKKQRADAAKKKEKRQKIILIVGSVLLVAIGAYEIPSMLAVMNKKPPNTTYDPGPSLTPGGLPNVASTSTGSHAASGGLVNSDVPPASDAGQLVSFSVFETKNPFTPQVSSDATSSYTATEPTTANKSGADVTGAGAVTTTATASTAPATPAVPAVAGAGSVVPSTPTPPTAPAGGTTTTTMTTTAAPATPAQPTVAIKVNGVVSHLATEGTFPKSAPVFRLVSWTKDSARVAIVGGSYATGDASLTVQVGEPVTLENQTDGKRYTIELLSTG